MDWGQNAKGLLQTLKKLNDISSIDYSLYLYSKKRKMRTEKAIRDGKDPKDPVVQQELAGAAYNDALRAVFMQDNPLTDAYSNMIRSMEKDHPAFASAFTVDSTTILGVFKE